MFSRCTNRSLMMKCTVPLFSSNWLGSPKLCSFSEYYCIIIHTSHQFDGFHFFSLDAEIGVQVPSYCLVCPLYMLFDWSLHRNQNSQDETTDWSCPRGSVEKNIPNVICVLHKHCTGQCQPEIYSSLLHADHKIFHPCNDRFSDSWPF